MSDTTSSMILEWAVPPESRGRGTFDPEVFKAVLNELQEHQDDEKYAVIKRGVSLSWSSSNRLAKELKTAGCKLVTRKMDDGSNKYVVYARYAPNAPASAKAA